MPKCIAIMGCTRVLLSVLHNRMFKGRHMCITSFTCCHHWLAGLLETALILLKIMLLVSSLLSSCTDYILWLWLDCFIIHINACLLNTAIERRHPFATVTDFDQRMDNDLFESQLCQRPYQYLSLHVDKQKFDLNPYVIHGTTDECVKCLTRFRDKQ